MTESTAAAEATPAPEAATSIEGSSLADRLYRVVTTGFAVAIPLLLFAIAVEVVTGAWPALSHFGFSFLTGSDWDVGAGKFGAGPMIYGTVVSSLLALLLATPFALGVAVFLSENDQHPEQGSVTFVDNTVDRATGTIRLKGTFANPGKRLWPGQFVNVVLTLAVQPKAIVVPSQAIQTGQSGQYVFIVKPDFTAEPRAVTVGRTVGEETVIEKGLQPGEKVVTDGQLRLIPGAKVEVKSALGSSQGTPS